MATIYEFLRTQRGKAYNDKQIESHSWLVLSPYIEKQPNEIAGQSRVWGDISAGNQALVIDLIIEICTRHKLAYREIAFVLLMVRVESGFNPDAAAGTTSAAGLAQYTKATVTEARKPHLSKHFLGFELDLTGKNVFDAERGAYGALLSYLLCKQRAAKYFPEAIEENIYLFHHEGWYLNPTGKDADANIVAVRKIIKADILGRLDEAEKLLQQKTKVQFTLNTADNKPYVNQPFTVVLPVHKGGQQPAAVQHLHAVKVVTGVTDGQGRTPTFEVAGLSEVVFSILNVNYKKLLHLFPGRGTGQITSYKVGKGDSLSSIAKSHKTTVDALAKANRIKDVNQLSLGQVLRIPSSSGGSTPAYWWRRPEMDWLASVIASHIGAEGLEDTSAVIEHKRSHVALPTGNKAHDSAVPHNNIMIAGGKNEAQLASAKRSQKTPHVTNEAQSAKAVFVEGKSKTEKKVIEGLLYPLAIKATADYHADARRFGSNRASGRKHAGIDLYAPSGTVVRAMSAGKVLRVYPFYCETYAIEIDHGNFVARYGEVDKHKSNIFVKAGDQVQRGEQIGLVGHLVGIKVPSNMLHLEMYASTGDSPLTVKDNPPYQRRKDLIDPTPSIDVASME
ncbi:MAG: LysM peptidoglycan-binding domain-containing protein [Aquabacterium sp.]|uniref:LysM peptidoglycan-binding domain-containing protein n=1 Tax=Aquabacterium sp. TaxID=1872578 RepID=UPI003BE3C693